MIMIRRVEHIIITGGSATGKTTLIDSISQNCPHTLKADFAIWRKLQMDTTRPIRAGEVQGYDYNFINEEIFWKKWNSEQYCDPNIDVTKYLGNYYGTPIGWLQPLETNCLFTPTSSLVGEFLKTFYKEQVCWIHLVADAITREGRLKTRDGSDSLEIEQRLVAGDSLRTELPADYIINTSQISTGEVLKHFLTCIN